MQPEHNVNMSTQARTGSYDAGLRTYFQKIYNTMTVGLVFTGAVAFIVANSPALHGMLFGNPLMRMILMLSPLAFIFFGFTPRRIMTMSSMQLAGLFYTFSALLGISFSFIFLVYSGESIARVFFITAAMFAGTSVYGYVTKRDLYGMRSLLVMGVWGLLIAMLVNLFMQSAMVHFVISGVGVIVYTGLIAWDTQNLKLMYSSARGHEGANEKMAIMGALSLYINFINLFQFLLSLMGSSRN